MPTYKLSNSNVLCWGNCLSSADLNIDALKCKRKHRHKSSQ